MKFSSRSLPAWRLRRWCRATLLGFAGAAVIGAAAAAAPALQLRTAGQASNTLKFNLHDPAMPGFCIEVIRALERIDAGLHFVGQTQELPLLRIENDLAEAQVDVFFGLLKTPERQLRFRFLEQPALYMIRHQVAVRADDPVQVSSFADIRALGKDGIVLSTRGTAYLSFLAEQGGLLVDGAGTGNAQNLRKLLAGRGRFFYQADSMLRAYIRSEKLDEQIKILPAVFKVDEQRVALSPRLDPAAVVRLTAALQALEAAGELARIRGRYGL